MTALFDASGARIPKSSFPATNVPDPQIREVTVPVYKRVPYGPTDVAVDGTQLVLAYPAGTRNPQSEIDAHYPAATVTQVTPATGPAAGGTVVTITGTNLSGVSGVTFGGTAGTNLQVISQSPIKVTTPARAAGAVAVVVADDAGNVTVANGYTYV